WAVASSPPPGSTTTTTPCTAGTLTGTAFKGVSHDTRFKALKKVTVTANPGGLSAVTGKSGTYSIPVPCGTFTKTAAAKNRVCHFGSATGPTTGTAVISTSGQTDNEN